MYSKIANDKFFLQLKGISAMSVLLHEKGSGSELAYQTADHPG